MLAFTSPIPSVSVYSFGKPMETGAFPESPKNWTWTRGNLPSGLAVTPSDTKGFSVSLALGARDAILGLGLHMGSFNCRGNTFRLFNTDCPVHIPSLRSMYGAHPFMIVLREKPVGIFIDAPGEVIVDAGASTPEKIEAKVSNDGFYLAVIEGNSTAEIVSRYIQLTGNAFVPPKWAFGYHQSRWSYETDESVRKIAHQTREHDIPCDVIHMDIHYMQDYKVFTVNNNRFPDVPKLSSDLLKEGIRLISIIDPGVKAEEGYSIYDEGKKNGYFCQRSDGKGEFVGAVWPGPSVFPDFFRDEVQKWWGQLYKPLKEAGFAGFWNDMNEPSIFYTPDAFKEFAKSVHRFDTENDFGEPLANLLWDKGICNRESYYDEFSHTVNGERVTNREVHNLFGTQMTKAVADALTEDEPQKRHFVLSRSSYPGMHRYAAIWTGDNHSWWEHLSLNIQQLISLNLAGFLFVGADTGGFGGDCTPEMLVRWTQLSAFAPFFRNHAAMWSKNQEPWAFDDKTLELCRASIKMRYALMPYIYGEFVRSACLGEPFIRGLFHDFKDAEKRLDEDQFLCGRSLLIAPVVKAASHGRMVYLPTGSWLKVRGGASGLSGERVQTGGDSFVEASLAEIPLYLKLGSLVPMIDPPLHTGAESTSEFRMIGFTDSSAECVILLDDGERKYSSWSEYPKLLCSVTKTDGTWNAKLSFQGSPHRKVSVSMELWSSDGKKSNVSIQC